jgi:hypothetical protein
MVLRPVVRIENMTRTIGLLLGLAVASRVLAQMPDEQKVRDFLTAAITAKGGSDRLRQLPAWHIKYRETFLRDGTKTTETGEAYEYLAHGQARYQTAPDDFIVVNGKQGWIKKGAKVTALTAGQLADFQEYFKGKEAMLTVLPLLTQEWQVSLLGEKEVAGRTAVILRIARKSWTATTYWDKQTHLLIGAEYPHKRLIEPDDAKRTSTPRESRYRDYKAFEGIQFPQKLLAFSRGKPSGEVDYIAIAPLKQLPEGILVAPK